MKNRRGLYASLLVSLATAIVFALAPLASAYDPGELPLALDAMDTYSPEKLTPPTNDGKHDVAVGGGQHGVGGFVDCKNGAGGNFLGIGTCVNEGFSAQSDPNGENAKGRVSATFETPHPYKLRGPVLCLDVNGNEAFILVMQTEDAAEVGFPQGEEFLLHVLDMGNPIMGTPPDRIANVSSEDAANFVAPSPLFPCGFTAYSEPLQRGNIIVRDVS
jgi:hypothetical protein